MDETIDYKVKYFFMNWLEKIVYTFKMLVRFPQESYFLKVFSRFLNFLGEISFVNLVLLSKYLV